MKRQSIPSPFPSLPEPLDPLALDWLVWHMRLGLATKDELHQIFMSHVRLAISLVSEYSWRLRIENKQRRYHPISDLIQSAMLGMAEAMRLAPKTLTDNNITPYLVTRMRGAIIDAIQYESPMPARTYRQERAIQGQDYKPPRYQSMGNWQGKIKSIAGGDSEDTIITWEKNTDPVTINDDLRLLEIMEVIERCVEADTNLRRREYKRVIVRLRAAGYTYEEIAEIIEVSKSFVAKAVEEIEVIFWSKIK